MSDKIDGINKEFDDWISVLDLKLQKLKLLVDLGNDDECNELISLLDDIKNKDIVL